jgi:hypothetical protein
MNLERISISTGNFDVYMSLAKISDFSKLYTTAIFEQNFSMQKINTGESISAFNFKNIEQFKGTRPFKAYSQERLLYLYETYGSDFLYQTKLHSGDLVRYNGLKYVVLGIVVNTYAQWNMPTPLLFNPTNVNNDFKSLYGSRLTEEQINSKINDNFQAGKYDTDMVIPLVDANDFSEYITVVEPRPTRDEVDIMFDSVKAEKNLTIKSQKDVFIDTMLRLRGNEINKIKEVNEDLFKGVQTLLLSVNKAVNEKIELLPEPVVEKPERKPREKKVVEEVEPMIELPEEKFDVISVLYFGNKFKNISDLYEILKEVFKKKTIKGLFNFPIYVQYLDEFRLKRNKSIEIKATTLEPQGLEFNFETMSSNDFLNMLMIQFPEYNWAKFDGYEEDLPDFISEFTIVKDLPEPIIKLARFRRKNQGKRGDIDLGTTLSSAFNWDDSSEGINFWSKISNEGDLREFKKLYGNKGEKVDELIAKEEVEPKEPVVETQEVKYVEVIVYPPSGGVLNLKAFSIGEMIMVFDYLWDRLQMKELIFNISAITDLSTYTTKIEVKTSETGEKIYENLIAQFDIFVEPKLDWKNFGNNKSDSDILSLNKEILKDAFKPKVAPVVAPTPAPVLPSRKVEVEKPKPKPIVREKPRPVPVEKPKPVKVEKPKVEKVVKQKVTKPKVEDDLSFLDDLDNIF